METETKTRRPQSIDTKALLSRYVDKVSRSVVVKEVLIVEGERGPVIWNIVEAPPLDVEAADPVVDALTSVFSESPLDFLFDFSVLNISEYPTAEEAYQFVPRRAKSIWRRNE
mgnify:CR=1 FL=1